MKTDWSIWIPRFSCVESLILVARNLVLVERGIITAEDHDNLCTLVEDLAHFTEYQKKKMIRRERLKQKRKKI